MSTISEALIVVLGLVIFTVVWVAFQLLAFVLAIAILIEGLFVLAKWLT